MEQLASVALLLSLCGGIHDLLTRRIPNWLTFPAILAGFLAQGWFHGGWGALDSLGGIVVGFAIFFPMYLFAYMGAGDVKLLMAVGAWLGVRMGFQVAVASVLLGAAYALVEVIYRGRLWAVAKNIFYFLRSVYLPGLVPEKLRMDRSRQFAFGVCVAGGVALVIYLRQTGRLA